MDTAINLVVTVVSFQLMVFFWMWISPEGRTQSIARIYVNAWRKFGAGIWWLFSPFFAPKK